MDKNSESELKTLLENVSDTYDDFVCGMLSSARRNDGFSEKLIRFMKKNPEATTSEIIVIRNKFEGIPEWNPETNQFEVPEIPEI